MRLLTWNVLKNTDSWWDRRDAIIDIASSWSADIMAFQEVPDAGFVSFKYLMYKRGYDVDEGPSGVTGDRSYLAVSSSSCEFISHHQLDGIDVSIDRIRKRDGSWPDLVAASYHGHWGNEGSGLRLAELSIIDRTIRSLVGEDCPAFIMGDFNAVTSERATRYMRGLDVGMTPDDCTYWTDAQVATRTDIPGGTSLRSGLGAESARRMGIRPSMLPIRTIDHIMSLGWNYGKNYGWRGFNAESYENVSDHSMLVADTVKT